MIDQIPIMNFERNFGYTHPHSCPMCCKQSAAELGQNHEQTVSPAIDPGKGAKLHGCTDCDYGLNASIVCPSLFRHSQFCAPKCPRRLAISPSPKCSVEVWGIPTLHRHIKLIFSQTHVEVVIRRN